MMQSLYGIIWKVYCVLQNWSVKSHSQCFEIFKNCEHITGDDEKDLNTANQDNPDEEQKTIYCQDKGKTIEDRDEEKTIHHQGEEKMVHCQDEKTNNHQDEEVIDYPD